MKAQMFFCILYFLIIQFINAQITPIEITNDSDYTIYKTNQYNDYVETIENQSPQLKLSIYEALTKARYNNSGFHNNFFKETLSEENHNILINNRGKQSRFSITYIINENGNVFSCALRFPTGIVMLSSNEIEDILSDAMGHSFVYIKKPQNISSFYFTVKCNFIL